jgi:hypothetical protein
VTEGLLLTDKGNKFFFSVSKMKPCMEAIQIEKRLISCTANV